MTLENVRELMGYAENVTAELSVRKYILSLVTATRNSDYVKLGVSPRGSIALLKASKAYAFVQGRGFVMPDDVKAVMPDVLAHRLMLSPKGKSAFENEREALENIALTVKSPDAIEK
jgi:MoxR-like ATPase